MNGRMIFGFFWLGLVCLLSVMQGIPRGYGLLAGNAVIAMAIIVWGMTAKGYFRADDD